MSVLNADNDNELVSNEEIVKLIGKDLERFALSKQREEEQKSIQFIRYLENRSKKKILSVTTTKIMRMKMATLTTTKKAWQVTILQMIC
jgi:hypothetical protein